MTMSKPQFITALRRSFGDHVLVKDSSLSRLYESFDYTNSDAVDWREFIYLLMVVMQGDMTYKDHLK